jgi:hypothetical protein
MPGVYPSVLFVHVVAAMALVGHSLGTPITRAMSREAGSLAALRNIVGVEARLSRFNPLVALVLLGTGAYLGRAGWWQMPWFYVAAAGWVVNSILGVAVVKRDMQALGAAAAAAGDGPITRTVDALRNSTRLAVAQQVMLANNLGLLYLMMLKPTLAEALGALAVSNLVFVGAVLIRRREAGPSQAATMSEARTAAR